MMPSASLELLFSRENMYNRRNTFAGEMSKRAYESEHRGSMTRGSNVQVKEFRNRNMQYRLMGPSLRPQPLRGFQSTLGWHE